MTEEPDSPPPPPAVPASVYDADYFLHRCAGAEEWRESGGTRFDALYRGALRMAELRPGEHVVDLGTGRGELLAVAIAQGAARAVGVEYASAAVALARRTLQAAELGDRAEVLHADARSLPLPDACADLVTMLDVVEHLTAPELDRSLREALRILRPGGRVFIHTFPTSTLYDVTYRLQRRLWPGGRGWPADPRHDFEHVMHVGEQSLRSLRRALRSAGFGDRRVWAGEWVYADFVPDAGARALYARMARVPLVRRWFVADLWATARRPAAASAR